ncbi:hypothetical protein P8452_74707 [Trifolium repens]|nr:hypothetical protein P8452_74707 [Trifolium repens]
MKNNSNKKDMNLNLSSEEIKNIKDLIVVATNLLDENNKDVEIVVLEDYLKKLKTPEVLELSKEIKEKLKEADKYDLEGLSNMRIQALEIVEELRIKRADKQVSDIP